MEEGSCGMVHVVSVGTYVGAVLVRFTDITTACLIWVERTYSLGSSMRGYPNVYNVDFEKCCMSLSPVVSQAFVVVTTPHVALSALEVNGHYV